MAEITPEVQAFWNSVKDVSYKDIDEELKLAYFTNMEVGYYYLVGIQEGVLSKKAKNLTPRFIILIKDIDEGYSLKGKVDYIQYMIDVSSMNIIRAMMKRHSSIWWKLVPPKPNGWGKSYFIIATSETPKFSFINWPTENPMEVKE